MFIIFSFLTYFHVYVNCLYFVWDCWKILLFLFSSQWCWGQILFSSLVLTDIRNVIYPLYLRYPLDEGRKYLLGHYSWFLLILICILFCYIIYIIICMVFAYSHLHIILLHNIYNNMHVIHIGISCIYTYVCVYV